MEEGFLAKNAQNLQFLLNSISWSFVNVFANTFVSVGIAVYVNHVL